MEGVVVVLTVAVVVAVAAVAWWQRGVVVVVIMVVWRTVRVQEQNCKKKFYQGHKKGAKNVIAQKP